MDISELSQITTPEGHRRRFLKDLTDAFANFSKPIIAAVVGYAVRPSLLVNPLQSLSADLTRGGANLAWWWIRDRTCCK